MRALVAATGWPGHVFPALALALALRDRGHDVELATSSRFRGVLEEQSLAFVEVPEYGFLGFPPEAAGQVSVAEAVEALRGHVERAEPQVVVSDIFSVAPSLAAELAGIPVATLIPYHYPVPEPGSPFFAGLPVGPVGMLPPRTPIGAGFWRALRPLNARWLEREQHELNLARRDVGLAPRPGLHGLISQELALVATFPQLEYPRRWPAHVHPVGPMPFEMAHPEVELPGGDSPLVVVASSTLHDAGMRLIGTTLAALADEPVRVLAAINERGRAWERPLPPNARVVDWAPYSQVMPEASLVICHGGHGTIARSLAEGVPVLVCPAWGDQADNGARAAWARAGLAIPGRAVAPRSIRWSVRRILGDPAFGRRARELASWAREHAGAARGAELTERLIRAHH